MGKAKKNKAFYASIFKFLGSKTARGILGAVMLICSAVLMLLVDKGNTIRRNLFPFLENNKLYRFLEACGLETFEVLMGSWIVFALIFIVGFVLIAGIPLKKLYVNTKLEDNKKKIDDKVKAKKRYEKTFVVYEILAILCIFVIALIGIRLIPEVSLSAVIDSIDLQLFGNILLTLAIILAIIVAVILVFIVVYYAVMSVFWAIGFIIHSFSRQVSKVGSVMNDSPNGATVIGSGVGGLGSGSGSKANEKDMLYAIAKIDEECADLVHDSTQNDVTLEEFVLQFQSYAINNHKIYYELPVLRAFVAGMAASRLIILEGLSGTGKSMLPRMFSEFTQCKSFFAPVQSTWRDKSDMLGYYSEFTKLFKVTDFLKRLYRANYFEDINMMVLDEMNLSRIEYYFADFLSIIEYPKEDWKIRLIEPEVGQKLPAKLENGYVRIPANTWFIGTANTDDSTFTITDKVYDRAFVIDFSERFSPIASDYKSDPLHIDAAELERMFEDARETEEYNLTAADEEKFLNICDFVRERFDIRFGNRIMTQIKNFVPVYVAMGGRKEEALDVMFARKVLRKLNGMYDDYLKVSLVELRDMIRKAYGRGLFVETEKFIDKFIKRLV